MRRLLPVICFAVVGVTNAGDDIPPTQWEMIPGLSAHMIVAEKSGTLVSSDALPWPDGRSALITYYRASDGIYRCTDFKDESYRDMGFVCHKLVPRQ